MSVEFVSIDCDDRVARSYPGEFGRRSGRDRRYHDLAAWHIMRQREQYREDYDGEYQVHYRSGAEHYGALENTLVGETDLRRHDRAQSPIIGGARPRVRQYRVSVFCVSEQTCPIIRVFIIYELFKLFVALVNLLLGGFQRHIQQTIVVGRVCRPHFDILD